MAIRYKTGGHYMAKDEKKKIEEMEKKLAEIEKKFKELESGPKDGSESKELESGPKGGSESKDFGNPLPGIGDIFSNIGSLLNFAEKMAETGERTGEIPLGKDAKAVYGFSARWLGGGNKPSRPVFKKFGNIREVDGNIKIDKNREPLVDVFEDKERITIMAEIPGVEEKDITIELKEKKLVISTKEEAKTKYSREIELSAKAKLEKQTYKNGVLEINLKKEEEKTKKEKKKEE